MPLKRGMVKLEKYNRVWPELYLKEESFLKEKLKDLKEEFLHIGDTLESDYLKPIQNGWNAIYYGKTDNKEINSITLL